jgi:hypothetical protein
VAVDDQQIREVSGMSEKVKPSVRVAITNWHDYEAPFMVKLKLLLRNNWIKIKNRSSCCGNHGEPGC